MAHPFAYPGLPRRPVFIFREEYVGILIYEADLKSDSLAIITS